MQQHTKISKIFNKGLLKEIWEWTCSVLVAIVVALIINIFILELYTVQQTSMWPTFQDGDQILAWKLGQMLNRVPDYGDVIIVDSNVQRLRRITDEFKDSALVSRVTKRNNEYIWIKRVLGKPGDHLEFIDNSVYRNGILVEEAYIIEEMKSPFDTIIVPDNHIYVMGDNRNNSKDSRLVGPIPFENVRGRVLLRFYPFKKLAVGF